MVKNFIHILRTYLITFRYLKKNEINYFSFIIHLIIYTFIFISLNTLFISFI